MNSDVLDDIGDIDPELYGLLLLLLFAIVEFKFPLLLLPRTGRPPLLFPSLFTLS